MFKLRAQAHALLELLHVELAAALDALTQSAGRALGPYPGALDQGTNEPDGYAGLGREVNYERLLASEWLLADEAPDEFLRRAAEREHAFLALARTSPRTGGRCEVVVDCGPDMLGLPRIAMLAVLLALELRAHAASLEFSWRVLGSDTWSYPGITDKTQARAFLHARAARDAALEDLPPAARRNDELWVIGSPRWAERASGRAHCVALEQPWGERKVKLTIARRGCPRRQRTLEMPAEPLCVRLLRDPFRAEHGAELPPQQRVQGSLLFAGRGHRLLALRDHGKVEGKPGRRRVELLAHSIPAHPGASPGHTRSFHVPPEEDLLGAAYTDRLIALTLGGDTLRIYGLPPRYAEQTRAGRSVLTIPFPEGDRFDATGLQPLVVLLGPNNQVVCMAPFSRTGMLLVGRRNELCGYAMKELLLGQVQGGRAQQAVWVVEKGDVTALLTQNPHHTDWRTVDRIGLPRPDRVFFSLPRESADTSHGAVALVHGQRISVARLSPRDGKLKFEQLFLPATDLAVGLTLTNNGPQVVVLEADTRSFVCLGRRHSNLVLHAPEPVEQAQMSPHSPLLAYATRSQWTLYDLTRKCVLWTLARDEEAP